MFKNMRQPFIGEPDLAAKTILQSFHSVLSRFQNIEMSAVEVKSKTPPGDERDV
jgi:hypothetical protein